MTSPGCHLDPQRPWARATPAFLHHRDCMSKNVVFSASKLWSNLLVAMEKKTLVPLRRTSLQGVDRHWVGVPAKGGGHTQAARMFRNVAPDVYTPWWWCQILNNSVLGPFRSELKNGKERDFQVTFEASVRPSKFINKGSPGSFSGSTSNCRLVRHPPGCTPSRVPLLSLPSPPSPHHLSHTCQSASGLPLPLMSVKCQDLTASIRDCHEGLPESPTRLHPAWYHQTNCSASTTSSW